MIRDITLGQYYPVDSVIHRMDPRTKLFGTMVFIISLFLSDNIVTYVIATIISGDVHPVVQSAIFLYGAGIEGHCVPAFDQCQL